MNDDNFKEPLIKSNKKELIHALSRIFSQYWEGCGYEMTLGERLLYEDIESFVTNEYYRELNEWECE